MKKIILTLTAGSLLSISAIAADGNACTQMHIQIANLRNVTCILIPTSVYNIHGVFVSPPPITVSAGGASEFVMRQSPFFGPEYQVSYKCGDKTVTFSSQQNKSVLWAGRVKGSLNDQLTDTGITATHSGQRGSCLWGTIGQSNWTIN